MNHVATITIDARMLGQSGIGTYLEQLLPRVVARNRDLRFVLLVAPDLRDLSWADPAQVEVAPCGGRLYSVAEQRSLASAIPRDTDLFWAPHYVIPLLYRGKLLVTVHDVCHLALAPLFGGVHKRLYARGMFAMVRRRADRIIAVSEFTRREFSRWVGAPRGQISVVHNGVDDSWFAAGRQTPQAAPGTDFFLYVGNVKPHKNLRMLLAAFAQVKEHVPHRLVVVGKRDGFITGDPEVGAMAERIGERVQFTGHLPAPELRAYVAGAAALVFPSLYEGFGLPPLEAMAARCPALVSNAAAMPEVCGDAARYFDPSDPGELAQALLDTVRRPVSAADLERARSHARSFSWDATAAATTEALRSTLGR